MPLAFGACTLFVATPWRTRDDGRSASSSFGGPAQLSSRSEPVTSAAAIAAAFPDQPLVTWSSHELVIAGVGIAREVRGHGEKRWRQVIEAAQIAAPHVVVDGAVASLDTLGFARPRWLGGAAFAPGAADRAPWTGFGDAWFVLPRWTYVASGDRAMFVLAADAADLADPARWQAELARLRACTAPSTTQPALVELQPAAATEWHTQVTDITDAIARGEYSKIVAARTLGVALAGSIDAGGLLAALDERHADCVRVLVRPPGAGTLVAATPERLVRRDGATVQCDALAGTINTRRRRARQLSRAPRTAAARPRGRRDPQRARAAGPSSKRPRRRRRALRHVLHLHKPFHATCASAPRLDSSRACTHARRGGTPRRRRRLESRRASPSHVLVRAPIGWFDSRATRLVVAIARRLAATARTSMRVPASSRADPDRELAETDAKFRDARRTRGGP